MSPQRNREVRRATGVRLLRAGMAPHTVGEIIEVDYGAAQARVIRSVTRPPTDPEAEVFRDGLQRPGTAMEAFEYEYEYLDE